MEAVLLSATIGGSVMITMIAAGMFQAREAELRVREQEIQLRELELRTRAQ